MCKGKLESLLQVVIGVLQACCSKMLCVTRGLAGPLVSLSWLWLGPSDPANWPYGGRLRVLEALQVAYIACVNEVTDDVVAIDALPCASIIGVR
jgi:hypothetical protein